VANLRVATSESWRDKATGERKEKTEWPASFGSSEPTHQAEVLMYSRRS
jgi:hypothetical protein